MIENAANTKEVLQSPQIGEQCLDLLIGAALPLEHICHVFAYGSGAIPQQGEDPSQKMVDFILVSNDSREFHRRNLELNPGHYSRLIRALASVPVLPFSKIDTRHENIYWFQRDGFVLPKGARVFYNTMIPTRGRLIKYGVIETEDFEKDLLDWQWLYVAGRLHKPVLDIPPNYVSIQMPNRPISQAIADNQWMASLAALCMMQSSEFTMDNFLKRVVCHSYKGDVRMGWAEDRQKIDKLVAGAGDALRQIYIPILKKDNWVHIKSDSRIEHDYSTPALYHRLQMLPYFVQRDLCNSYYPQRHYRHYSSRLDIEELIFFISHQHDLAERLDSVLQGIVQRSSLHQSFKNALTAGFSSFAYIWPKLRKGYFRR